MIRGNSTLPAALLILSLVVVIGLATSVATPVADLLADPPEVSLDVEQPRPAEPDATAATVVFAHAGGDSLPAENVHVVVDGERVADRENLTLSRSAATFGIGERIVLEQTEPSGLTGGERVVLIYERGDTAFRLRATTVER